MGGMHLLQRFQYYLLNKAAQAIKGKTYQLDSSIPVNAMLGIGCRRLIRWTRSMLHGFSWKKRIFIGRCVELRCRSLIQLGYGVTLGDGVLIDALSREGVVLGDNVNIGESTRIEASGTITNIGKGIKVGNNSGIGAFSFIGGAGGVVIGNDVIMGQWVSFHPENHNFDRLDIPIRMQGINRKGIVVEDNCWIGAKVTFIDGAHVGHGCVVAAGALVRGYIPPFSVAAGVPARVIRSRKAPRLDE